ncbi:MAG TPA: hypothetical protein VGD68_04195 [Streptosporangiaceae bacterium]
MASGILAGAVVGILFLFAVGFAVGILIVVSVIGHRSNDGRDRDDDDR